MNTLIAIINFGCDCASNIEEPKIGLPNSPNTVSHEENDKLSDFIADSLMSDDEWFCTNHQHSWTVEFEHGNIRIRCEYAKLCTHPRGASKRVSTEVEIHLHEVSAGYWLVHCLAPDSVKVQILSRLYNTIPHLGMGHSQCLFAIKTNAVYQHILDVPKSLCQKISAQCYTLYNCYTVAMNIYYIGIGVCALLSLWALGSLMVVWSIEQPSYSVVADRDGYQIRTYEAYIVAQTQVSGSRASALTEGFRVIADYIFGNNTNKSSIAMTAPVLEQQASQKISMTSPVLSTDNTSGESIISFVLPSQYSLQTLPTPNNPQVSLREVPAQTVAVLSFTWYATDTRIAKKQAQLLELLERDSIAIAGDIQVAQYNPPLSMPLVLRNEIIVPIAY
jgi:hypothetical protein